MTWEEADGSGYARAAPGSLPERPLSFIIPPIPIENVAVRSDRHTVQGVASPVSFILTHAPAVWEQPLNEKRPLCEVAGGLDSIEWPWFALVPGGVKCPDCLEWIHA